MILTFAPIGQWPEGWIRGDEAENWSPFKSNYSNTLGVLERELLALDVQEAQIQLDIDDRQIRITGQLKEGARVGYHGCILTIDTPKYGVLVYSCNAYDLQSRRAESWKENLRAIALGLEALRKVERYGIANRGQQYAGWAQLGTGIPMGTGEMTRHQAAVLLAESSGLDCDGGDLQLDPYVADAEAVTKAYRAAAKRYHPDSGVAPDEELFGRLTQAKEILERSAR